MELTWSETYLIHHRMIDEQHESLFRYVNALGCLLDGSVSEETGPTFEEIFAAILRYAEIHFRTEEEVMREVSFPDYIDHKRMHERFQAIMAEYNRQFRVGELSRHALYNLLRDWLSNHVCGSDQALKQYIKGRASI